MAAKRKKTIANRYFHVEPKAPAWNSNRTGGKANKPQFGTRRKRS